MCRGFADLAVLVDSGAGDTYHWLAATDTAEEGQWVWQDGTPVTDSMWKSREFPQSGPSACARMFLSDHRALSLFVITIAVLLTLLT